ncbi:ring finger protein [Schistosoma japonicum]|nr:ring finger protein [Schistosoma japonicum]
MPIFNHCPIQAKDYCHNGGECFYLSGDPSVYMCSCFMPFYGPQCEHKAPNKDKQNEIEEIQKNINNNDDNESDGGILIKRSVDRAMTLTALIFIVVTFLGMLLLAWYISRRRRKDYARWRKMTELAIKSNSKEKSDKQTQIRLDFPNEKETSSLINSIHSMNNNSHSDDGDFKVDGDGDDYHDVEAVFELTKSNLQPNDDHEKQNTDQSSFKLQNNDKTLIHSNSSVIETTECVGKPESFNKNQFTPTTNNITSVELPSNEQIELNHKRERSRSKRIAPTPDYQIVYNHQVMDTLDDNTMTTKEHTEVKEVKEIDVPVIQNFLKTQSINKSKELDHNFNQSTISLVENQQQQQQQLHKSHDHLISNTIDRKLCHHHHHHNHNQPKVNILSNAILDRRYINADEIHALFDQNRWNSTVTPYQHVECNNSINAKLSSTLPRDYKQELYSSHGNNSMNKDQLLHCLHIEYNNNVKLQEPFTVASQHDALLSELLHRGNNLTHYESRPKSTF